MKSGETKVIPSDRIMLGDPYHVCLVVRDVEKTAAVYSSLFGVGPFTIRQVHSEASQATVHGEPTAYTLKFGYARTGTIILELVETVEGHTIYEEFLAQHGEGLHHLGFRAPPPLDDELVRWRAQGIEPLQVNRRDDPRYGWAYMDTQALAGCLVEIVCDPPLGWWESLALAKDLKGPLGRA
ncbi:MAG: VOC family protein [Bacillota bacterium]|nr:VOC family protein [Bacillota bacterium]